MQMNARRHQLGRCLLLGAAIVIGSRAEAQSPAPNDPREPQPERPSVATHAYTVAPGILEIEAGAEWHKEFDTGGLLKIGLTNRLQLDIAPGWARDDTTPPTQSGFTDTTFGVKWRIAD